MVLLYTLGYLKDHDFNRTAREFEQESRYSKRGIMTNQVIGKVNMCYELCGTVEEQWIAVTCVERFLLWGIELEVQNARRDDRL